MSGKNISPDDALAQSQITSIEHDGFWLLTEEVNSLCRLKDILPLAVLN